MSGCCHCASACLSRSPACIYYDAPATSPPLTLSPLPPSAAAPIDTSHLLPPPPAPSPRSIVSQGSCADPLSSYIACNVPEADCTSAPIAVGPIHLQLVSHGRGATLDARGQSRHFEVHTGAVLLLHAITLANGHSDTDGGTLMVDGGRVTLSNSTIVNSSASAWPTRVSGGAVYVTNGGHVAMVNSSSIVNATADHLGGALHVDEASCFSMTGNSKIIHATASRYGGAVCIDGTNSSLSMSSASAILNSSATDRFFGMGGAMNIRAGGTVVMTGRSTIANSVASGAAHGGGGALYMLGGSLTMLEASSIVNSTAAAGGGGAILCLAPLRPLSNIVTVADGSSIMHSSSGDHGGAVFMGGFMGGLSSIAVSGGSSILNSSAQTGGSISMDYPGATFILRASCIIDSMARSEGGAMYMKNGGTVTLESRSSIINSTAETGGAAYVMGRSSLSLADGSSIVNSAASTNGGALYLDDSRVMVAGSSMSNSNAEQAGGAVYIISGQIVLSNESMITSSSASPKHQLALSVKGYGGAMYIAGGSATFNSNSSIVDSYANDRGGAVYMTGGILAMTSSSILKSDAGTGGAMFVTGGSVSIADGRIIHSTAVRAGAFYLSDGIIFVSYSLIAHCHLQEPFVIQNGTLLGGNQWQRRLSHEGDGGANGGGTAILVGGELHLDNTTVEDITSYSHVGVIFTIASDAMGTGPLLSVTFTEFRQHECNGSLFSQQGPAQVLLRSITVTPLAGCNHAALASPAAFAGIGAKDCGETYLDREQRTWGVCSLQQGCVAEPLDGTSLTHLFCECPWPYFPDPALSDSVRAPYLQTGGCIEPMRLTEMAVVSKRVVVALSKPENAWHSLNVTLYVKGTDVDRPATWTVLNASQVMARSPWLHLPAISGETDAHAISSRVLDGRGSTEVQVQLVLKATGQRERAAPYEEM
eukprot:2753221-Prymnesium_polylepis.1